MHSRKRLFKIWIRIRIGHFPALFARPAFIALVFLVFQTPLLAQEFSHRHYTIEDGLIQSQVQVIHQDYQGYMWMGTKGGLSRFDGIQFRNFTRKNGLPDDFIHHMASNDRNQLLIVSNQSIAILENDSIRPLDLQFLWRRFPSILAAYGVASDFFMVATNPAGEHLLVQIRHGRYFCSFPLGRYRFFKPGYWNFGRGIYYFIGPSGLCAWERGRIRVVYSCPAGSIYPVQSFSEQFGFANTTGEVFAFPENEKVKRLFRISELLLPDQYCIFDRHNRFITNSFGIIRIYSPQGRLTGKFKQMDSSWLLADRENNLWVTSENGVILIPDFAFMNYEPEKTGIIQNVYCLVEDAKGTFIISSPSDGTQFMREDSFFNDYEPLKNLRPWAGTQNPCFYIGSIVDHQGVCYLNSGTVPLFRFDGKQLTAISHMKHPDTGLFLLDLADQNILAAGTSTGFAMIDKSSLAARTFTINPGRKRSGIVSIAHDKYNRFWLGNFQGISLFDLRDTIHLPTTQLPFSNGAITLYTDYRKNIWIGNQEGLFLYDYQGFRQVGQEVFNYYVVALKEIDPTHLMVGSLRGIGVIDLEKFYQSDDSAIRFFDRDNGYLAHECQQNAIFRDRRGRMWIPAADRVVCFDPKEAEYNETAPTVLISGISYLNKNRMEWVPTPLGGPLRFEPNQNSVQIDYRALAYKAPGKVRYSYYLTGPMTNWSEPTGERQVRFTDLPPGTYEFRLRACNEDGVWAPRPVSLPFEVVPALYQQVWFQIMAIGLTLGAVVSLALWVANRRKRRQFRELQYRQTVTDLKLKSFRNQLAPHFLFNIINSIGGAILNEKREEAWDALLRLSTLLRALLETSEQIVHSIQKEIDFLQNFLELERFRKNKSLDYEITVSDDIDPGTQIPKMLVQIHAENAIKHAFQDLDRTGKLLIRLSKSETDLLIVIEDNGRGRSKATTSRGSGKGLAYLNQFFILMEALYQIGIDQHFYDLKDEEGRPAGTRVEVRVPLALSQRINHEQDSPSPHSGG